MFNTLIVEDEPLMRDYLLSNLTSIHSQFKPAACARDGIEALEILMSNADFDLVLTDIKMPRMDGLELASYIHTHHPNLPVIILTGHSEFELVRNALKSRAVDYLLKPLNDKELFHVLQSVAERRGTGAALSHCTRTDAGTEVEAGANADAGNINMRVDTETDKVLIKRATDYIQNNFQTQLSLGQVAEKLGVSYAYLSNLFHTEVGMTYSQYILKLRMELAARLLKTYSAAKVYDIAGEVGYVSTKHFIAAFKKYFAMTPNEFRHK